MLKSFKRGGIHPPENKLTAAAEIEIFPLPLSVTIPLSQHIGAPAIAVVEKGDRVKVGQLIGRADGFVSSNIHSSVSGVVKSIGDELDISGIKRLSVVIDVEGDEWMDEIKRDGELIRGCELDRDQIVKAIAEAGIVGLGGATFPTQVKLSPPEGMKAKVLIINGAECEPYLTSDHRVMLERAEELLEGIRMLAKALDVERSYIGVENNKRDAIWHLNRVLEQEDGGGKDIVVVPLKVKYPQGCEKQLIAAITKREVPSGALPVEIGVVVQNVGTALAVYEAINKHKPLIESIITVAGKGVASPKNVLVRVGTPISALLKHCGGELSGECKVVSGGPMMGRAVVNLDGAVTKGTSGVLVMEGAETRRGKEKVCVKCSKCIGVCPMGLQPYMLYKLASNSNLEELERLHVTDCIECGSCVFTCPARLPILDYVRIGKAEVIKMIRSRRG